MKYLKFSGPKQSLILSGRKDTTWRVSDEKAITAGDTISLCNLEGTEFAKAQVTSARITNFKSLTEEDMKDHEFRNNSEMYRTMSGYYRMRITPETSVKVIKFRLMGQAQA
jgi:hypothetical protein